MLRNTSTIINPLMAEKEHFSRLPVLNQALARVIKRNTDAAAAAAPASTDATQQLMPPKSSTDKEVPNAVTADVETPVAMAAAKTPSDVEDEGEPSEAQTEADDTPEIPKADVETSKPSLAKQTPKHHMAAKPTHPHKDVTVTPQATRTPTTAPGAPQKKGDRFSSAPAAPVFQSPSPVDTTSQEKRIRELKEQKAEREKKMFELLLAQQERENEELAALEKEINASSSRAVRAVRAAPARAAPACAAPVRAAPARAVRAACNDDDDDPVARPAFRASHARGARAAVAACDDDDEEPVARPAFRARPVEMMSQDVMLEEYCSNIECPNRYFPLKCPLNHCKDLSQKVLVLKKGTPRPAWFCAFEYQNGRVAPDGGPWRCQNPECTYGHAAERVEFVDKKKKAFKKGYQMKKPSA